MLSLDPETRDKLAKLIRLLASDVDGEVLGAAHAMRRLLAGAGGDLHELAEILTREPEAQPAPPAGVGAMAREMLTWPSLTQWEIAFVASILSRYVACGRPLSSKQIARLHAIWNDRKVAAA